MQKLSIDDFRRFAKLIYAKAGIHLSEAKREMLSLRLSKRMRVLRCNSFRDYFDFITSEATGKELLSMLDVVTTNKTDFFREVEHFNFLQKEVFPLLFKKKKRISIWCAACSSGEEPYTVAMLIMECLPNYRDYEIKILATDISTSILETAKKGIYTADKVMQVPPQLRQKYFTRQRGKVDGNYCVRDDLKKMIFFRILNLMEDPFPFSAQFDVIFCRNVLIYFDRESQKHVIEKIFKHTIGGGYFLIGHSESLNRTNPGYVYVAPAIYLKKQD